MPGTISQASRFFRPYKPMTFPFDHDTLTLQRYLLNPKTTGKDLAHMVPRCVFEADLFSRFYNSFFDYLNEEYPLGNLLEGSEDFKYPVIGRKNLRISLFLVNGLRQQTSVVSVRWYNGNAVKRMNFDDQTIRSSYWSREEQELTNEWHAERLTPRECWLYTAENTTTLN